MIVHIAEFVGVFVLGFAVGFKYAKSKFAANVGAVETAVKKL